MNIKYRFALALLLAIALGSRSVSAQEDDIPANSDPQPAQESPGLPETPPAAPVPAAEPEAPPAPEPAPSAAQPPENAPAGTPAVIRQNNVNIRAQAAINSEIVARLKKGDKVIVLEETTLKTPKTDEPPNWSKIALPEDADVWVHSSFIDPSTRKVTASRLNLRAGPGENYSILGRVDSGTEVHPLETKGVWLKIDPPPDAYAFVASHLIEKQEELPFPVAADTIQTPDPVTEINAPPDTVVSPPVEEEMSKRIVTREGIVKRSVSIQAPTYFVLESKDTGRTINYLHSPASNFMLRDYEGQRILVTGEELLDERWPNTPVINVEELKAMP